MPSSRSSSSSSSSSFPSSSSSSFTVKNKSSQSSCLASNPVSPNVHHALSTSGKTPFPVGSVERAANQKRSVMLLIFPSEEHFVLSLTSFPAFCPDSFNTLKVPHGRNKAHVEGAGLALGLAYARFDTHKAATIGEANDESPLATLRRPETSLATRSSAFIAAVAVFFVLVENEPPKRDETKLPPIEELISLPPISFTRTSNKAISHGGETTKM